MGLFLADTDFTGGHLWLSSTARDCLCVLSPGADQEQPYMALHACSLNVLFIVVTVIVGGSSIQASARFATLPCNCY